MPGGAFLYLEFLWGLGWPLREQARSHRLKCVLSGGMQSSRGYFVWWGCGGFAGLFASKLAPTVGLHSFRQNAINLWERACSRRQSVRRRSNPLSETQPIIIDFLCKPFPAVTHAYPSNQMCNRPPRRGAKGNAMPRFRALKPPVKNKTQRCACRIRRVCE